MTADTPYSTGHAIEKGWPLAVVDGSAAPGLGGRLRASAGRAVSLFAEPADREMASVAPYLVRVDDQFGELLGSARAAPWGVFVAADAGVDAIRFHLRRFLSVRSPAADIWFFRFYDPRVLGPFVRACTALERREFFGPIHRFGCPRDDGVEILDAGPGSFEASGVRVKAARLSRSSLGVVDPGGPLFRLRDAHVAAFEGGAEAALRHRIARHLRTHHGAALEHWSVEETTEHIARGLSRARGYGVVNEDALTMFVALAFEVGPDFDRHPVIASCLQIEGETADERVLRLGSRTSARTWVEARSMGVA